MSKAKHARKTLLIPIAGIVAMATAAAGSAAAVAAPADTAHAATVSVRSFTPVTSIKHLTRQKVEQSGVSRSADRTSLKQEETGAENSDASTVTDAEKESLLQESTNVTVTEDSNWGGIETLDVPQTESAAEKAEREAKEEADRKAAEQAALEAQQQAALQQAQQQAQQDSGNTVDVDALVSASGSKVIEIASQYLGVPYVYGGASPDTGFDCSGLTQYVYAQLGISLPHQSEAQRAWAQAHGTQVSAADAQPGDLMWHQGHVGIYVGDGMILHAPTPGDVVRIQSASYSTFEYYRIV